LFISYELDATNPKNPANAGFVFESVGPTLYFYNDPKGSEHSGKMQGIKASDGILPPQSPPSEVGVL
jgi:hypothetical protein